ncbi:MAG TPA: GNAT family N-acetyltransferase [Chthoniobacter sp.]|nr:GNAT family N-acetyltransferase [Chthoniobacter sp.]
MSSSDFEFREARETDLPALAAFFRRAYGETTVFQDHAFLRWYFLRPNGEAGLESLVAVKLDGTVAAHYGGLTGRLLLRGRPVSMVWGANAFTLPEYRGSGLGGLLVEQMMERHDVFGVIGFTPKTAEFYSQSGFNVFGQQRFVRHTLALSDAMYDVARAIGTDEERLRKLLPATAGAFTGEGATLVGPEMARELSWPISGPFEATTFRDLPYLQRRFFAHPYIRYQCLAVLEGREVRAALFTRREALPPTEHAVVRIVDLFGEVSHMPALLRAAAAQARIAGACFVDAALFGEAYASSLAEAGFVALREDDAALLPQVTAPIEARPNQEYLGLFSRRYSSEIGSLAEVHFTRADSDRDRIARLSQIPKS